MTIASATSRISYTGDSSTTAFAVPFFFQTNADLVVYLTDTLGNQTLQALGTNYTLTGATVSAGGTCTFLSAPTTGYTVTIYRDPPVTQTTSYNNNDPFPAKSHELALDKLTTIEQRTRDIANRSIHLSDAEAATSGTLASIANRKNKLLGFDTTGALAYVVGPTFVNSTNTGVAEVDSKATAQTVTFPGTVNVVVTRGNATPGDGGGLSYIRGIISSPNNFQDAGGNYWTPGTASTALAGANTVNTAAIITSNVTYAKIQNVTNNRLLGNFSGSAAAPSEISIGNNLIVAGNVLTVAGAALAAAQGLIITNNSGTPNSQIDISADSAVLINPTGNIPIYSLSFVGPVTCNTATTGVNALDTGTRAASTWYHFYLISDGGSMSTLASLSATAPTMPGAYTYRLRIGAMRTDGSGNFLRSRQAGNKTTNLTSAANLPAIVTTNIGTTYLASSVTGFVPPTAVSIFVSTWCQSNGTGPSMLGIAGYQAGTAPSTQPYPEWEFEVNSTQVLMSAATTEIYFPTATQQIFVAESAMSVGNVAAAGWRDKVNAS